MAHIPPDPTKYGLSRLPHHFQYASPADLSLVSLPPDLPLWYPTDQLDHIHLPHNHVPVVLPTPAYARYGPWDRKMFKGWDSNCLLRYDPSICGK